MFDLGALTHPHVSGQGTSKDSVRIQEQEPSALTEDPRGSGRPAACCLHNKTISKRRRVVKANTLPGPALAHDVDVAQGCERVRAQRPSSVVSSKRIKFLFLFFCTASLRRSERSATCEVLRARHKAAELPPCDHSARSLMVNHIRHTTSIQKRLEERASLKAER
eukprot:scaffold351_cov117-Isochrysis_galbana.AAC.3